MKVIDVIPIKRGIGVEELSYFTPQNIVPGMLVEVPLRKKTAPALVVRVHDASDIKADLKNSTFALRKIERTTTTELLRVETIAAMCEVARYFACTAGSALSSLIPQLILKEPPKIAENTIAHKTRADNEHFALQAEDEERFAHYKSLIREEFARGFSVVMCLPTIEDIKRIEKLLLKGIEQYTFILHSGIKKNALKASWEKAIAEEHPALIICTPQFLCIPKLNIGTIIVEREGSRAYKMLTRPYIDMRVYARILAKKIGARLIFGDMLLRVETQNELQHDTLVEYSPLKFRVPTTASQLIVDMKQSDTFNIEESAKRFSTISDELKELIAWNQERNEHLFVFCVRKGLAPLTVCGDCGTLVSCENCSQPVVLYSGEEGAFYQCTMCGKKRDPAMLCKHCNSWKLTTLGVGIEKVEEEILKQFPDVKVLRIDASNVKTHKQAEKIVDEFYASPGSILLGTEMALLYLHNKIENTAIASIDSLFSLPDFRINERVLAILLKIRAISKENFVIQTRDISQKMFDHAVKGNLVDFYRQEVAEREQFGYPPFSTFIKVTALGEKNSVVAQLQSISENIMYECDIYPAFNGQQKDKIMMHLLIKIPAGKWPDPDVSALLAALPPQLLVRVDPESIL
jgi:primosomal protein N' (replication factor Y)